MTRDGGPPDPRNILAVLQAWLILALLAVVAVLVLAAIVREPSGPPPLAPCPPAACAFHPHAPHKAVSNP